MKRKGSLLLVVIVLLALVEIMTLIFIGVVRRYKSNTKRIRGEEIALNYAEEGLNGVINILMRDPDWDFRTAGSKSPTYGFPNTVPYAFNFQSMNYKVEILDSTNNPIYANTGTADNYFNTEEYKMWVKITGFYYPHDNADEYRSLIASGGNTIAYQTQIIKRTIVAKVSAAVPIDPFNSAIFSCGTIDGNGSAEVQGDVCAPTVTGTVITNGNTNCAPTADDCDNITDALSGWANDICDEANDIGQYYTDSKTILTNGFSGLNDDGKLEGKYCMDGDVSWAGNAPGVDPVDVNGDMDYSDEELGEVPPPIIIIKGNLKMTGTPYFKGIVIVMGEYTGPNSNLLSGNEDFMGTIVSFDSMDLKGNSYAGYMDFSKYVSANRNKVSRSGWIIGDKPIKMQYNGNNIVVSIQHLTPPNPATW